MQTLHFLACPPMQWLCTQGPSGGTQVRNRSGPAPCSPPPLLGPRSVGHMDVLFLFVG